MQYLLVAPPNPPVDAMKNMAVSSTSTGGMKRHYICTYALHTYLYHAYMKTYVIRYVCIIRLLY